MSISPSLAPRHPLPRLVDALTSACDEGAEGNAWSLSDNELRSALPELTRVLSRLSETQMRMLAGADRRDLGQTAGHHDTAGWYAVTTRTTVRAAKAAVRLARTLDADAHEPTRVALAQGRVCCLSRHG